MCTTTFGTWLEQRLRQHEWTQADFARKVGTSPGVVSHWMHGERTPDPESCDKIADVLHESLDVVLAIAGHRSSAYDRDTPDQAALISLIRKIDWNAERVKYARSLLAAMVVSDQREAQ